MPQFKDSEAVRSGGSATFTFTEDQSVRDVAESFARWAQIQPAGAYCAGIQTITDKYGQRQYVATFLDPANNLSTETFKPFGFGG